jgi:hypothetical protein
VKLPPSLVVRFAARYHRAMKLMLSLALLVACGASQKEVAVQGSDMDLARVAGDWVGEYKGNESGRSGPVNFSLQVGSHIAEGQVIMGGATPLKIEFVKVNRDEVKGTIAPYTDPNCSCEVQTTFLGTLGDDVINGSFETKVSATGQSQTGTWSVTRKR